MSKRHHPVRIYVIAAIVVTLLMLIIYYASVGASDDSSTARGALIGAQVETGTPVTVLPAKSTVTLMVTGDRSSVTYNNGHRAIQVKGPFKIVLPLENGRNYTIGTFNARPGNSVCTIKINNKEVATSKALGQDDTAGCVIVQNKVTHSWTASSW